MLIKREDGVFVVPILKDAYKNIALKNNMLLLIQMIAIIEKIEYLKKCGIKDDYIIMLMTKYKNN